MVHPPPGTAVSSSPGCVAHACDRHWFLQAAGLSPPVFSEAEYECYLVSAGRPAANWRKKMLGNDCKQKVMNTYKVCSGDWEEEQGTRSWAHGEGEWTIPGWWGMNQVEPPSEVWAASVHSLLPQAPPAAQGLVSKSTAFGYHPPPSETSHSAIKTAFL